MILRQTMLQWCDAQLQPHLFKDYAPNGLQVEGSEQISRVVTAVTASRAAIEFAVAQGAEMLLVHHGMFWKSEPVTITGWKGQRIATLLKNNVNLVGYHLPLDGHAQWGNNVQLAKQCGWQIERQFGEQDLMYLGRLPEQQNTVAKLTAHLEQVLGRTPTVMGNLSGSLKTVAWCTGGAQGFFQQAIDAGADVYITGEMSESQFHLANETGVVFISAGHHATERYGVQALGAALVAEFGLDVQFFDEANPV